MKNVGIVSVGKYVPQRVVTNFDLEKLVETSNAWIVGRTGIHERRIAEKHERSSHMAVHAAREALKNAKLDAHKVELIIVATTTPDSAFPSVGCLVQKALSNKIAAAFDVSAACSGYLYSLTTAKKFIETGMYKNALVIATDKFTTLLDWNDRQTCVLFGDGAGACVLAPVRGKRGILSDFLLAHGEFAPLMMVHAQDREPLSQKDIHVRAPYVTMRGPELFKIAVNSMSDAVAISVERAGLKVEDIDVVVPHQANDRIISAVAKKLRIPKEKFFINIEKYGNMSAAAIAVALYEAVEQKRIKRDSNVALVTFGAGLVSAANVVRW